LQAALLTSCYYYGVNLDGAIVADPSTRTYFGSGWWNSGIEIPAPDQEFYQPKDVPRGRVSEQWYYSKVTRKWRRCFVYTPPDYDGGKNKYPVFYLLHGWGEDETAWFNQGRVDFIMDSLIAEKKAKPMIIVMDNLNAAKPGESAMRFAGRGLVPDPATVRRLRLRRGEARPAQDLRPPPRRRPLVVLRRRQACAEPLEARARVRAEAALPDPDEECWATRLSPR
jgi:enterochelin esterase-like enzyme